MDALMEAIRPCHASPKVGTKRRFNAYDVGGISVSYRQRHEDVTTERNNRTSTPACRRPRHRQAHFCYW